MRIAIAAGEEDHDGDVSYFGGRAPCYLILDEQGNLLSSFRNPYTQTPRHAGYDLSNLLIGEEIDAVIAGRFGPTMIQNLSDSGIKCVVKRGRIRDALREFLILST